ncbi:hypothetical protein GBA52_002487 [Prunus armeniaca]|nr:hypothetical protein GBA52_002487 [Prunus armeniaca]
MRTYSLKTASLHTYSELSLYSKQLARLGAQQSGLKLSDCGKRKGEVKWLSLK